MRVRLLGPIEVASDGEQPGPRDRVVLAALAVRRGMPVPPETLADALWPQGPPASWTKVIQGCVSRLRTLLGADSIETVTGGYRLRRKGVELDRDEFEELVERGRQQLHTGVPERAAFALARALDMWHGPPFGELAEWLPGRIEATRLNELRLEAQEDLLQARLDAGEHREVAAEGMVLVGEEPWRERRWELLALAQYRSGRQADALATIRTARRTLGRELGLDPGSGLVDLEQAILAQDPALAADHEARTAGSSCPWQGLAAYDAEHRDTFFGRADDVDACLARLDESPLLGLVGPSGSGKSSLMRAGLVPALRARGREVVVLTPGVDPLAALTAARAATSGDAVLCVDQMEEVFTGALGRGQGADWLAALASYALDRAPVVFTMRSDYVSELSLDPRFATLVERGLHLVAPLSGEALRETIEGPARVAGLRLEQGLVDLLLRDAAGQPGALPLLSHALSETWQRREGTLLTVDAYHASGGISGAVAASADRLHQSLTDLGRDQLRWLMLRMGSLADHGEPVRTPVPREVATDGEERARVLDALVRARLVTSADGTYELAHESLVRAWPRLRTWLEEDRDGQRLWRHLATAAEDWDSLGRPDSELYTGIRLAAAREWATRVGSEPTRLERAFLDASIEHAEAGRLALEQQTRHEKRQNRRLRGLLLGVAVALVLALVAAVLAVDRGRSAAAQRDRATAAETSAVHEALVSRSLSVRPTKRDVAALLAVEAYRTSPDSLSQAALLGTFTEASGFMGYRQVPFTAVQGAAIPGTHRVVMASGTELHVVDLATGRLGPAFDHPLDSDRSMISVIAVSGDGRRAAQLMFDPERMERCGSYDTLLENDGRGCTWLTVFDLRTREAVFGPVRTPVQGGDLAIARDGGLVAVAGGFDGDLVTYDVDRRHRLGTLMSPPRPETAFNVKDTAAVAFAGNRQVLLGSLSGPIRRVDPRTLEVTRTYAAPPGTAHNYLRLTSGGTLVGAGDHGLIALDTGTGRRRWLVDLSQQNETQPWPCQSFAVAEDPGRIFCGSSFGSIGERDLATGAPTGRTLDTQRGETGDLTVAGGNELVELGRGYYYRWRLDGTGPIASMVAPGARSTAGYDPSGRYLAVQPRGSYVPHDILDARSGERVLRIDRDADAVWVADHTLLLRMDGTSLYVDVATGRRWHAEHQALDAAWDVFPSPEGRRIWAGTFPEDAPDGVVVLAEFVLPSGTPTGRTVQVRGSPYQVVPTADGDHLWVNYWTGTPSSWLAYEDELSTRGAVFDIETGERGHEIIAQNSSVDPAERDRMVASDWVGNLREYDLSTGLPGETLPGARGVVAHQQFSADGTRFLATGADPWVNVYDTDGWVRLGTIPSAPVAPDPGGRLRADGQAVAVNVGSGVIVWSLDLAEMADAACELAGRNLTRGEWATYLGDQPYRRTCPQFPAGG